MAYIIALISWFVSGSMLSVGNDIHLYMLIEYILFYNSSEIEKLALFTDACNIQGEGVGSFAWRLTDEGEGGLKMVWKLHDVIYGWPQRCVLSLERKYNDEVDEFQLSGRSEFQSRGPMTEKARLSRNVQTLASGLWCTNVGILNYLRVTDFFSDSFISDTRQGWPNNFFLIHLYFRHQIFFSFISAHDKVDWL